MPVDYLMSKPDGIGYQGRGIDSRQTRTIVEEHGINLRVNLNDGLNCGLFLDMRRQP